MAKESNMKIIKATASKNETLFAKFFLELVCKITNTVLLHFC